MPARNSFGLIVIVVFWLFKPAWDKLWLTVRLRTHHCIRETTKSNSIYIIKPTNTYSFTCKPTRRYVHLQLYMHVCCQHYGDVQVYVCLHSCSNIFTHTLIYVYDSTCNSGLFCKCHIFHLGMCIYYIHQRIFMYASVCALTNEPTNTWILLAINTFTVFGE